MPSQQKDTKSKQTPKQEATGLEYLKWFFQNADFGPADGDVRIMMEGLFEKQTNKKVPDNLRWNEED